jgi:3-methyladenine DNA glycosylase AlkD
MKSHLTKYLTEVKNSFSPFYKEKPFNGYNSPTPTLGISLPTLRSLLKNGYSFFSKPPNEILEIWDYIWKNAIYMETMGQAIRFYEKKSLNLNELKTILSWVDRCNNWAHSDGLSDIYSLALEENPSFMLPILKKWNKSSCPWKRRQSVVSLLYYSRARKKYLPYETLISFITPLLNDNHYYVQKGVGWTIRETFNIYPIQVKNFLEQNVLLIQPGSWQAATEKLEKPIKAKLTELRKARKRKSLNAKE